MKKPLDYDSGLKSGRVFASAVIGKIKNKHQYNVGISICNDMIKHTHNTKNKHFGIGYKKGFINYCSENKIQFNEY